MNAKQKILLSLYFLVFITSNYLDGFHFIEETVSDLNFIKLLAYLHLLRVFINLLTLFLASLLFHVCYFVVIMPRLIGPFQVVQSSLLHKAQANHVRLISPNLLPKMVTLPLFTMIHDWNYSFGPYAFYE